MSQPTRPRWAGGCPGFRCQLGGCPGFRYSRIPTPDSGFGGCPIFRPDSAHARGCPVFTSIFRPLVPPCPGFRVWWVSYSPPGFRARTWVSRIHVPVGVPYSRPVFTSRIHVPYSRPVFTSRIHVRCPGIPSQWAQWVSRIHVPYSRWVSRIHRERGCPVFTSLAMSPVGVPYSPYSRHATPRSSTGSVRAAAFGHLPVTFRADSANLKNQIQREARAEDTQWLAQFLVWHWLC